MKRYTLTFSCLSLLVVMSACNRDKALKEARDKQASAVEEAVEREVSDPTLSPGGYDLAEMDAAIARAQAEVDNFIAILDKRQGYDFSVKAPITDKGQTEHFWMGDVTYDNGVFEGIIDNEPAVVSNVKLGQKWKIKKADISDWSFKRNGKIHGNYTMRPLLKTLPKDDADYFRSLLANP
jgi:uncharacterized protein YegJ (DUF2314 family)